ncbi:MAG: universal stress protein [Planctomycetota bacterium]|nr:universal stress protein [Planctomycetota bacterium]
MLVSEKRPRNLSWLHAGPLLFGDWGTSRLYVLGLSFYYTAHASLFYLLVMSVIMAGVAWGYTVVCRSFPDGGGVYSAARRISPLLSVVAATLLLCDFIVTAALSAIEGFHYLGVQSQAMVVICAMGTMGVLGALNWFGAKAAGRFALVIAIAAIGASAVIGALCIPLLPEGLRVAKFNVEGIDTTWDRWESLVRIVLALSGVEAVASMTGLMKEPVPKTAKRTIWPVLLEVVILNTIFCIAINALPGRIDTDVPDYVKYEQRMDLSSDLTPRPDATPEEVAAFEGERERLAEVKEYRQTAVKVLGDYSGSRLFGPTFGNAVAIASGIVFGLLLLSAANTAILAMVSVFYALGQDNELPRGLTRLNYSGVPWVGLLLAAGLPALVLLFVHDDKALAELYAIGVVGAIAINMACCAANRELVMTRLERAGLWGLAVLMSAIELTIIVAKPHATVFAGSIVAVVLGARYVVHARRPKAGVEPLPTPEAGWLAEIRSAEVRLEGGRPRIMLAARGRGNAEFAVDLARRRNAILFVIYVRTLRVIDVRPGQMPTIENDAQAQEALGTVAVLAKQAGVPIVPIYVTSPEIADEILDYTVTFGCDTLIMGKTRRGVFSRAVAGDVLATVSAHLPEGITLVTRAATGPDGARHEEPSVAGAPPATTLPPTTPATPRRPDAPAGDDDDIASPS